MFLGRDTEVVVEGVMPDRFHVVPVRDDAMVDGVREGQDAAFALGVVADVGVFLAHAHHDVPVARAAHEGRNDGAGGLVASETGLAPAGAVVDHKGSHVVTVIRPVGLCRVV